MNNNYENFKKSLKKSLLLTPAEQSLFEKIPNHYLEGIFKRNFNSDEKLASLILLNEFEEEDYDVIESEKRKIRGLKKATTFILESIQKKKPLVFVTDVDNDGSLSQSGILEFFQGVSEEDRKHMHLQYSQIVNGNKNRGLTVDMIELWGKTKQIDLNDEFVICTADNGINSLNEQKKIQDKYPKAKIIITDHHLPDEDEVVQENSRTVIFNPKFKPIKYFKKKNISGANTVMVLLKNVLNEYQADYIKRVDVSSEEMEAMEYQKDILFKNMNVLSRVAL